MDEARPRQKIRGKDEAEAETSRQGRGEAEADILRGKDEAAPNAASRQGICLEDYITGGAEVGLATVQRYRYLMAAIPTN